MVGVPDRHVGPVPRVRPARLRSNRSPPARPRIARLVQPVPRQKPHGEVRPRPDAPRQAPARPGQDLRQALVAEPDQPRGPGPLAGGDRRRGRALRPRRGSPRRLLLPVPRTRRGQGRNPLPRRRHLGRLYHRRRQARPRRLATGRGQHVREAAVRRDARGQAVGEGRDQPLRHLEARSPRRDRRLRPARQAVRRRQVVAQRGLGRLLDAATLLAHRPRKTELPEAPELVGRREHQEAAPVAGQHPQPRWSRQAVAGERDRRADQADAEGRRRQRPLQREADPGQRRRHRRRVRQGLRRAGAGPRVAVAR